MLDTWWFVPLILVPLAIAFLRDRVPGVPRVLETPPEEAHPAELAYLWSASRNERQPRDAFRAQLLHLVHEDVIELQTVGRVTDPEDFTLRLKQGALLGPDDAFVRYLFQGDTDRVVSLREVTADRQRGRILAEWLMSLRLQTMSAIDQARGMNGLFGLIRWGMGLGRVFTGKPLRVASKWLRPEMIVTHVIAGVGVLIESGGTGELVFTARQLVMAAAWGLAVLVMPQRLPTPIRHRVARWRAFRRFLQRGAFEDLPVGAIAVWERYLVYAVALGVGDQIEEQIAGKLPSSSLLSILWGWSPAMFGWVSLLQSADVLRYIKSNPMFTRARGPFG